MNKVSIFFIKLVSRIFPHTRVINFRTPDNIATCAFGVSGRSVIFSLLTNPSTAVKGGVIKKSETKYKGNWVQINFYTHESIDNFIEKLNEVKSNLELMEAGEILQNGGTMVWNKVIDEKEFGDSYTTQKYEITFNPKKDNP